MNLEKCYVNIKSVIGATVVHWRCWAI